MSSLWPWIAVAGAGALHGLNPATGWGFVAVGGVRSRGRMRVLRALVPLAAGHVASVVLVAGAVVASVDFGVPVSRETLLAVAGAMLAALLAAHGPKGWRGLRQAQSERNLPHAPVPVRPVPVRPEPVEGPVRTSAATARTELAARPYPVRPEPVEGLATTSAGSARTKKGCVRAAFPAQASLAVWSFIMSTAHGAGLMLVPALMPLCLAGTPGRELTASGSLAVVLAAIAVHTAAILAVTAAMAASVRGGFRAVLRRRAAAVASGRAIP